MRFFVQGAAWGLLCLLVIRCATVEAHRATPLSMFEVNPFFMSEDAAGGEDDQLPPALIPLLHAAMESVRDHQPGGNPRGAHIRVMGRLRGPPLSLSLGGPRNEIGGLGGGVQTQTQMIGRMEEEVMKTVLSDLIPSVISSEVMGGRGGLMSEVRPSLPSAMMRIGGHTLDEIISRPPGNAAHLAHGSCELRVHMPFVRSINDISIKYVGRSIHVHGSQGESAQGNLSKVDKILQMPDMCDLPCSPSFSEGALRLSCTADSRKSPSTNPHEVRMAEFRPFFAHPVASIRVRLTLGRRNGLLPLSSAPTPASAHNAPPSRVGPSPSPSPSASQAAPLAMGPPPNTAAPPASAPSFHPLPSASASDLAEGDHMMVQEL